MASSERAGLVRYEDLVFHPWAGDEEGHNCADCIVAGDTLHTCWREAHAVPRWAEDVVRERLGFPTEGRCAICGSLSHDEEEHRARR